MLGRTYDEQVCSVARTLEVVGERWTMLIVRDAFFGVRRFGDFAERLGVARNVLQDRLERLVAEGIMEKVPYQDRPVRYEYRLTDKGKDLQPVLIAMAKYGDAHLSPDGPPVRFLHRGECGGEIDDRRICTRCGEPLGRREIEAVPGPGAPQLARL